MFKGFTVTQFQTPEMAQAASFGQSKGPLLGHVTHHASVKKILYMFITYYQFISDFRQINKTQKDNIWSIQ